LTPRDTDSILGIASREGNALKRLYRSSKDRKLAGVCGGLGEYLGIDPTVVRVLWLFSAFFGGIGVIAYIAALLIVPRHPEEAASGAPENTDENRLLLWGLVLAAFGILLFFYNLGWLFPIGLWGLLSAAGNLAFPILFVLLGFVLIVASKKGRETGEPALRERRLVRAPEGRMVSGVCAGLGNFFDVDPAIVRLLWVVGSLLSLGAGVLLYLILLVVMPVGEEPLPARGPRVAVVPPAVPLEGPPPVPPASADPFTRSQPTSS
jgi:phage shock protein C